MYSVKTTDNYTGIIRSQGVIDKNLIKSKKRGILRALLSLLLQENTQSNIVRKLNSYARYTGLKKALIEYNAIFKSTHVLTHLRDSSLPKLLIFRCRRFLFRKNPLKSMVIFRFLL